MEAALHCLPLCSPCTPTHIRNNLTVCPEYVLNPKYNTNLKAYYSKQNHLNRSLDSRQIQPPIQWLEWDSNRTQHQGAEQVKLHHRVSYTLE